MTIGTVLSLSACGTSAPSAVGSYRATFVGRSGLHKTTIPLVLAADGRFVIDLTPPGAAFAGAPFTGRWSQNGGQVTLNGREGITEVVLVATETGKNLGQGTLESLGRSKALRFTMPWYAVRD
jgi:hypothetical protein